MIKAISILFSVFLIISCQKSDTSASTATSLAQLKALPSSFSAHWITPSIVLVPEITTELTYQLAVIEKSTVKFVTLSAINVPEWVNSKYPHLSAFSALKLTDSHSIKKSEIKQWLKSELAIITFDKNATPIHLSYVQTGSLLDDLYTSGANDANEVNDYGATLSSGKTTFKLWAPTAKKVSVKLFNENKSEYATPELALSENTESGVWSAQIEESLNYKFYQYNIEVYHPQTKKIENITITDPYSLSLSTNSRYSQVIDLTDPNTQPNGWNNQHDVIIGAPENNIFYETHIRDFSASDTTITNTMHKGKYKAFTLNNTAGIQHLKNLNKAGINNIHLLPTFDIGTVNENSAQVINLEDPISNVCKKMSLPALCEKSTNHNESIATFLGTLSPTSDKAQEIVSALRELDNYNWGYDPFHYTVPEGSYAVSPDGVSRIIEFREMIQSIHNMGFRVVMDVVYNHTHKAGLNTTSVLDKIVPNYYQRLNPLTGAIEQSTCCDNTATERVMMGKLMIDSLIVWAKDYKIDGFRFDLMAHQPKSLMLEARTAVRKVDEDTYFYGEGWNFGEVANNKQFIQASQLELGGTEIGTFTDRLRDAVRGGAFNAVGKGHRQSQGIGNGLGTVPNELQSNDLSKYNVMMDQLRIGLAGNLAKFPLINHQGNHVLGEDIPYGDQPTGYALDPADTINYVSKHDNQALWDNNQYRIAFNVNTEDRVRMQLQSLAFPIFAQGIPFIHMGSELLRSKSYLRDSYDYSDWFNRVDFSKTTNFYNVGLPPKDKDEANWSMIKDVIKQNEGRDHVSADHIEFSSNVFMELIAIRMSTPLFRLTNQKQILDRLTFHNTGAEQALGLIVMSISDQNKKEILDEKINNVVVIFNMNNEEKLVPFDGAHSYSLHPIQEYSVDSTVKRSKVNDSGFVVPALTTAVFIN